MAGFHGPCSLRLKGTSSTPSFASISVFLAMSAGLPMTRELYAMQLKE